MSNKLKRFIAGVLAVVILLGAAGGIGGNMLVRQSFPQVDGEIRLAGLDGPVDVYRDKMGIPHIYATTLHDLFMAQGYVHAQDRFWQMDFWRHIGSARLSEMFGDSQLKTDAFLRTLGWRQIAETEWQALNPESRLILEAYTKGVNAYLADHKGTALSLEYGVLAVINPDYEVEPWTPVHSLTWAKAMAWDLRGNMGAEIERSILLSTLTPQQVNELFPEYPADHPVIVNTLAWQSAAQPLTPISEAPYLADVNWRNVQQNFALLNPVLGKGGAGIGSNSWVVGGSRTTTGKPLLANDPHLGIQMPSIWYQMALHCQPKTEACPLSVGGFTFAGVPGVIIGHNDRIAWGFTNTGPDVMDLYIERVNPENPNQYEVNGQWVDMELRTETIKVAGGDPVTVTIRTTRHGPVISDTYGPLNQTTDPNDPTAKSYTQKSGLDLPAQYVIALRWTALEPGSVFEAIWGFNKASNWDEFRQAARAFQVPAQNLLYADVDGNIGYQMPGNVPMRRNGDGRLPVPGWTDDYAWDGYIPFEQLPYTFNPAEDYIVTANNRVPPRNYPYLITADWDYGFRAQSIVDNILNAPGKIDMAYMQAMQGDNRNMNAETLVPVLMSLPMEGRAADIRARFFTNWNYRNDMDSQSALVFENFWWFALQDTFNDQLPEEYAAVGGSRWYEVMRTIINDPNSGWWDDVTTPDVVETRDVILARAFDKSIATLEQFNGKDPAKWDTWGKWHTSTFRNATLGNSGIAPIEALFNRGPFETAGGESIVNATGWDVGGGMQVNWLPSMRMLVDLSNLNNSLTVHTTGQSGHAFHPHYIDMADLWRNIQYYPMWWEKTSIMADAASHLRLIP